MTLIEKLRHAQEVTGSMLSIGLDPVLEKFPSHLVAGFHGRLQPMYYQFLTDVIKHTAKFGCAFKPNSAFYEAKGPDGIHTLETICAFIKENYPDHVLIVDGKRGDVGDTAKMYAKMYLRYKADAVTVNPYLGPKTLEPYLEAGLGIFVLCVTSNPDAAIFQNRDVTIPDAVGDYDDRHITAYQWVAEVLTRGAYIGGSEFNWTDQMGLVTGATHPPELGEIRKRVGKDVPLLIPGIGKQGGDMEATMEANDDGLAIINVSSKVCHASSGDDFAEAAGAAADAYNQQVNNLRHHGE